MPTLGKTVESISSWFIELFIATRRENEGRWGQADWGKSEEVGRKLDVKEVSKTEAFRERPRSATCTVLKTEGGGTGGGLSDFKLTMLLHYNCCRMRTLTP